MFGRAPFHTFAPQLECVCTQFVPHEANDISLGPPGSLQDGFKGCPVFPSHLNDGGNITYSQV